MDTTRSSDEVLKALEEFASNYPQNLNGSYVEGIGWRVLDNCVKQDFILYDDYVRRRKNCIPGNVRLSFIDGTIYIKRIPGSPHEECTACVNSQLTTFLNNRIGRGSTNHDIGMGNIAQPDVSVLRNPNFCPKVCAEISATGTTTRDLVNQCRNHFGCSGIMYVLGIDILPFIGTNQVDKQVRILAHLFERGVNDNWAPSTVVSFGNAPMTVEAGLVMRNNLIYRNYPGYGNRIEFRGIGFDATAPPCDLPNSPYFRLRFDPQFMLQNDNGVMNFTNVADVNLEHLENLFSMDLFITQTH